MAGGLNLYKRLLARCVGGGDGTHDAVLDEHRRRLFASLQDLHGTVVEIGPGGGANFAYLPRGTVARYVAVEANPYMEPYLRAHARRAGLSVELCPGTAEHMDLPDTSADVVISTHVLCSVADQPAALREVLRVLKPGGRFLFIEHVAAPRGTGTRRRQDWIRPLWQVLADGCQPNRETWRTLEAAGFADLRYEHFGLPYPIVGPQIAGVAVR